MKNENSWKSINALENYRRHSNKGLDCSIVIDTNSKIKTILDELGFDYYSANLTEYAGEIEFQISICGVFDNKKIHISLIWYDKMGELTYRADMSAYTYFRDLDEKNAKLDGMHFEISFVNLLDKAEIQYYVNRLLEAIKTQRNFK